jgi:hypothetical protein
MFTAAWTAMSLVIGWATSTVLNVVFCLNIVDDARVAPGVRSPKAPEAVMTDPRSSMKRK